MTSFENETVVIALHKVCGSDTAKKFILDVIPTSKPEPWLRKQELIREDKPTVAGLFCLPTFRRCFSPSAVDLKYIATKQALCKGHGKHSLTIRPVSKVVRLISSSTRWK
jgi:ATP-dependent DNA helicase RecG